MPRIKKLAKQYNLRLVVLYGSYGKNRPNEKSDIDIAVLGETVISFETLSRLNNEFAQIFRVKNIDVKSLHDTNPLFRYEVMINGILIYESKDIFSQFKAFAAREYIAAQSLRDMEKSLIQKRQLLLKKKLYG